MSRSIVLHVQKVSGISGSEAHLLSLLPGLRKRGWDARMIVLNEGEPGAATFIEELKHRGVPVAPRRMLFDADPIAAAGLLSTFVRSAPLIVHTHLVHADLLALPLAGVARAPVSFSTKHGFNAFRNRAAFAALDRTASRHAAVQIAISRGLAEYLAEREGYSVDAFEIVHYGIPAGPEPTGKPVPGRVLCVGRLIPIKGHDTLLRAFADVRDAVPGARLALAGTGTLGPKLHALAAQLGVEDAVEFLGQVVPIGPEMERASVVAVPSRGEGFGMVALEAAERGSPVVASAVGGLPEIVAEGETGFVVPSDDAAALSSALVRVLTDPALAASMGASARKRALEQFAESRCIERTEQLYLGALERAGLPDPR